MEGLAGHIHPERTDRAGIVFHTLHTMSKSFQVAIVGASGAVGVEMLRVMERRNFPVSKLRLLASARSAGKTLEFRGEDVAIVGVGGVGMAALQGAVVSGARKIFVIDPVEWKRDQALKFGATHVYEDIFAGLFTTSDFLFNH